MLSALLGAVLSALIAVMNSISTMAVRDFILRFRPGTGEAAQVAIGRVSIVLAMFLGVGAAAVIAWQPEGVYKYLQTISIYLVMPLTPAIAFGILSRRVTFAGAAVSFVAGIALSGLFVADALLPDKALAARWFPVLHWKLTENYTYRGLWGTLAITLILFLVSAFTRKTTPTKLAAATMDWIAKWEPFQGLADWRLHLAILSLITLGAYWWMW